ncbi:MAG: CDP-alcohol phosphatidyltransferase family protein [Clostridiales bacterium]|nr:CDP-alcohol phosphatidyltransferase family protein [Clostridiales bacterium]
MDDFKKNISELFEGWNTIPNWLSFIRIALIPVFVVLFLKGYVLVAVIIMICTAFTDLFDGKIARKFNQVSNLGKLLDPIADKLSQMAIVIVLIVTYWDNAIRYLFMFFIAKELIMILGGALLLSKGLRPTAAEIWGKVATNVFYIAMIFILAFGKDGALCDITGFTLPNVVTWILVTISAICTLISLLGYAPGFIRQLKENKNQPNSDK